MKGTWRSELGKTGDPVPSLLRDEFIRRAAEQVLRGDAVDASGYMAIRFGNPAIGEARRCAGASKQMLDDLCGLSPGNGAFVQFSDNSV